MATADPVQLPTRSEILAGIRQKATEAILSQVGLIDTDVFVKETIAYLNKARMEVVYTVLGIEKSFGEWRVDRTNGRTSPLSQHLAEQTGPQLQHWITEAVVAVVAEEGDQLRAALKEIIRRELRNVIRGNTGYDAARKFVQDLNAQVLAEIRAEMLGEGAK